MHGADTRILYEAHPHLGTDKLPGIISAIRKSILGAGGQFILEKKVTDLIVEGDMIKGVVLSDNEKYCLALRDPGYWSFSKRYI